MAHIAHITSVHSRYDTRVFQKQCISLEKYNYTVSLIVADNEPDEVNKNINIFSIGTHIKNRLLRMLLLPRKLYMKAKELDCDLYIIHDPELVPMGLRLIRAGKKVIFDSHEDFPRQILEKEYIPDFLKKLISNAADIYLQRSLKKFSAIMTVTPHIAENLRKSSDNVSVISNFPIIESEQIPVPFTGYSERENTLCYAGTVYKYSMQEIILEAIAGIRDLRYIVVGTIDPYLQKKLTSGTDNDQVTFIKKVPKGELEGIYNSVTIGIVVFDYCPNLGYRTGTLGNNKIFEYMLHSLPIVCTDFDVWRDIVDRYHCGICVEPHSSVQIRNAILYLMEHKHEAFMMGQNGRQAVIDEFNWNTQELNLIKAVKNILE